MSYVLRVLAGAAAVALGLTLGACSKGGGPDVASVNGQKITRAEFDKRLDSLQGAKGILNQMAQGIMIEQYAKDNHISVTDSEVAQREDKIKSRYGPSQFEQILKSQGLTEDDVRQILREQIIVEKAVAPQVNISDAEVKDYLAKNHATLDQPEQAKARHILVADPKTAQTVEQKLKSGANFADVAKQYSTDPSSKDKGGDLGYFGKKQMVPAFANAAFSQKIGVIGPPVKSPFGYHIIQVEDRKPAQVATLANSDTKIRELLTQQKQNALIPTFFNSLKAKASIKIYDPELVGAIPEAIPAASVTRPPVPINLHSGERSLVVPRPGYGTPYEVTPKPTKT
jgi:foldase protein PrsA